MMTYAFSTYRGSLGVKAQFGGVLSSESLGGLMLVYEKPTLES